LYRIDLHITHALYCSTFPELKKLPEIKVWIAFSGYEVYNQWALTGHSRQATDSHIRPCVNNDAKPCYQITNVFKLKTKGKSEIPDI